MPRYVALLRGVSPMNARMDELKRAFESAGYKEVRTVLASGNVVFTADSRPEATHARRIEATLKQRLDRPFPAIVRRTEALQQLLESDPWAAARLPAGAKRIVTFLRNPPPGAVRLPIESDGARILAHNGREAFSAYVPSPRGPVFMALIEKTFGADVTTRTLDTVRKCAQA